MNRRAEGQTKAQEMMARWASLQESFFLATNDNPVPATIFGIPVHVSDDVPSAEGIQIGEHRAELRFQPEIRAVIYMAGDPAPWTLCRIQEVKSAD